MEVFLNQNKIDKIQNLEPNNMSKTKLRFPKNFEYSISEETLRVMLKYCKSHVANKVKLGMKLLFCLYFNTLLTLLAIKTKLQNQFSSLWTMYCPWNYEEISLI